jgi:Spy/CpxP family protein refolding chaperone
VSPRRTLLLALLTVALAFGAGTAVGAALERARRPEPPPALLPRDAEPAGSMGPRGRPPIFAEGPVAERLGLDRTQRDSLQRILAAERARADDLYREFRPRLRARYDSTTEAVEAVLTPEQRAEWARIRAERRDRWRGGGRPEVERRRWRDRRDGAPPERAAPAPT